MGRPRDSSWQYVRVISRGPDTNTWRCNFCEVEHTGCGNRIKAHLGSIRGQGIAACPNVPPQVRALYSNHLGAVPPLRNPGTSNASEDGSHTVTGDGGSLNSQPAHRPPVNQVQLGAAWRVALKEAAARDIRRCIYKCNLPFHVVDTPAWKAMISSIAKVGGDDFNGPGREALRTHLLQSEVEHVLSDIEPLKASWRKYGCSIITDGWSDLRRRSIINILISNCKGTVFLDAVDTSAEIVGQVLTGEYMYCHIRAAIDTVGPENVVQVLTDNGSNCVSMGAMVERDYPSIRWTPCVAHCLDLIIEDISKLDWVSPIVSKAKRIIQFITKKPKVAAIYRTFNAPHVIKFSITRYAYLFLALERLLRVLPTLEQLVVSDAWRAWTDHQRPDAMEFKRLILADTFWTTTENIIMDLQPFFTVLRLSDREGSTMGLLYEYMLKIGEKLMVAERLSANQLLDVANIWSQRWEWFHKPLHAVAHILHPLWREEDGIISPELQDGWQTYLTLYCSTPEEENTIDDQLLTFLRKEENFAREAANLRAPMLAPISWWEKYGRHVPQLMAMALKVLSQDCSNSVAERNWSRFGLVQTKIRNRLSFSQMKKLVFVQTNLRMIERLQAGTPLKEVNPDLIDISRVPTLPIQNDEREDHYAFLVEDDEPVPMRHHHHQQRTVSLDDLLASDSEDSEDEDNNDNIENEEPFQGGVPYDSNEEPNENDVVQVRSGSETQARSGSETQARSGSETQPGSNPLSPHNGAFRFMQANRRRRSVSSRLEEDDEDSQLSQRRMRPRYRSVDVMSQL